MYFAGTQSVRDFHMGRADYAGWSVVVKRNIIDATHPFVGKDDLFHLRRELLVRTAADNPMKRFEEDLDPGLDNDQGNENPKYAFESHFPKKSRDGRKNCSSGKNRIKVIRECSPGFYA